MKRTLLAGLALCLLLCGCDSGTKTSENPTREPTHASTEAPANKATEPSIEETTTPATEPITEPATEPTTEPATEPATEPVASADKVTVYLVERTDYYDSGRCEYYYDDNYNIISNQVYTLENELMYTSIFEDPDENGMPRRLYTLWSDNTMGDDWVISWFQDGKIKEMQLKDSFTGYQYEYDQKGDVIEKRSYYEGILEDRVCYEYNGSELWRVYSEDIEGNHIYDCRIEDGVIIEKAFLDPEASYSYFYEYDENGNWIIESFLFDGELSPASVHSYIAVEVDADRAPYLLEQQKYLLSIT